MKLSFFTMPIHPVNKPVAQSLREDREAFLLADSLGYAEAYCGCLLYTSPSPRDATLSRMPSSA